ncbi:recombinase family protein [Vibrio parahaemolyticus]|uniref:recombinase family protein n=1 Tax=Vibrio parahaemolyticus TaxID=670 RepID=UPI003CC5987E
MPTEQKTNCKHLLTNTTFALPVFYTEQLSGAKLERAELARLIEGSHRGSVLLIEKVDRLSHLPFEQWKELKQKLVEISLYSINR